MIKVNKIVSKRVVFVGSVLERKHAIEDLFTVGDYLLLYNEVFGKKHKVGEMPGHPDQGAGKNAVTSPNRGALAEPVVFRLCGCSAI